MPEFSKTSKERLDTCHNDLQALFNEVIKYFDCTVSCGFRNERDQNEALRKGNTKLSFPHSKHNKTPSLAVDVYPYPVNFNNPKYNLQCYYFGGFVMGIARKLKEEGKIKSKIRYGGDWNRNNLTYDESFLDLPHFEIDN